VEFRFPTAVFPIPKPSIQDSTFKIFWDSGILRTADVFPRSSPLRDVSRGGTSATQRQKFHTDDVNQCLHNKSGSHGVPNAHLFNFTCLLVDFDKVLCSSANELQKNSNIDYFVRDSSPLHLIFAAFCLLSVIRKQ